MKQGSNYSVLKILKYGKRQLKLETNSLILRIILKNKNYTDLLSKYVALDSVFQIISPKVLNRFQIKNLLNSLTLQDDLHSKMPT